MRTRINWLPWSMGFAAMFFAAWSLMAQQKSANSVEKAGSGEAVSSVKDVPGIEDRLVESVAKDGTRGYFLIPGIRPVGTANAKSKICIAGRGRLPPAKDMQERLGEGVVLKFISPAQRGSEINLHQGKSAIIFKDRSVDFNTAMYSVGAIWEKIPNLVSDGKIDDLQGVALTPGIRLGALYDGDGNLAFDYVRVDNTVIVFPGGTAGSIHRLVGTVEIGGYTFEGENDVLHPLTFLLSREGYIYLRGKGTVRLPSGERIPMGAPRNVSTGLRQLLFEISVAR